MKQRWQLWRARRRARKMEQCRENDLALQLYGIAMVEVALVQQPNPILELLLVQLRETVARMEADTQAVEALCSEKVAPR